RRATRCLQRSTTSPPIRSPRRSSIACASRRKRISTTRSTTRSKWRWRSESIAEGDWRLFFIHRDRWQKLTPADVTRAGTNYLKASNLTVGTFLPEAVPDRAPLPAPIDIPALVQNYKGEAPVAAGETFDPTPANLEARTERLQLQNGIKVALLPKKTRGETAQFELRLDM